jgi:hypothetical protein
MAALLRRRFGTTLNLGVGGFGPLLELATLKEYLEPVGPRIVLWEFFEGNDLTYDLPLESRAPLLRAYLDDPAFSQDLIHRSGDVGRALRDYVDRNMRAAVARMDLPWVKLLRWVSLDRMREAVGLGALQIGYNASGTRRSFPFSPAFSHRRGIGSKAGGDALSGLHPGIGPLSLAFRLQHRA